jgi:hypothetical protein
MSSVANTSKRIIQAFIPNLYKFESLSSAVVLYFHPISPHADGIP